MTGWQPRSLTAPRNELPYRREQEPPGWERSFATTACCKRPSSWPETGKSEIRTRLPSCRCRTARRTSRRSSTRFEKQLTREAKSKLTLAAFVPRPEHVDNQRYEPIFDRYPITGKTYTTASGTVVLNEVQYYNGEMVQFFGDCSNVARCAKHWQEVATSRCS